VFVVTRYFPKPAVLQFDQRQGSSDGGALLLKAADRRYGLIAGMVTVCETSAGGKVDHSLKELVAQRYSRSRVAIRMPTMRAAWPPIRFTRCSWTAIRARPRSGLAADAVAFRECHRSEGALSSGRGVGGQRDPAPCRALARSCAPRHPRSGSDRRSHSRAQQLSFFNRHYTPGATCR